MSTYEKLGGKILSELPQVPTNFSYNSYTGLLTWQNNNTTLPASGYTNELQLWSDSQSQWVKLSNVALSATTAPVTGHTAVTSTNSYSVRVGVRKTAGFVYPSLTYQTILQGSRIYAGGDTANIPKQYGLWSGMPLTATGNTTYGAGIGKIQTSNNYCYVTGSLTIKKYNLSDLTDTSVASPTYGGTITGLVADEDYVYAGGIGTRTIRRYNASDLTYVNQSANFGNDIYNMADDANYLYVCGTGNFAADIKKYAKTNFSLIASTAGASLVLYAINADDEDYVYAGGANKIIRKYNKSDLSYITQSPTYGGTIRAIAVSGNYVYAAGETTNTIRKYNASDLTYTSVASPTYGGAIYALRVYGDYIYAGGATTNTIRRYKLTDLTLVDSSPNYGGTISALALSI